MGGGSINSGDVIVQAVHNALSEHTAVIKVWSGLLFAPPTVFVLHGQALSRLKYGHVLSF
jgi:hypothetical protein